MRHLLWLASLTFFCSTSISSAQSLSVPAPIRIPTELPGDLYQLEGEHFTVIASSAARAAGEEMLEAAEKVRPEVIRLVGSAPGRTYILADSNSDAFNGFATTQPYPIIRAFVTFPSPYTVGLEWPNLWEYLIAHEYAHVAQLGMQNGFQKSVSGVLGQLSLPGITQARQVPAWLVEGIAVWVESRVSGAGRLQDPYSALVVMQAAREGTFPSLAEVSVGNFERFPGGNARYQFGGRFVQYLVETHGEAKFRALLRAYNDASLLTPLTDAWKQVQGVSLETEWDAFRSSEEVRAQAMQDPPTPSADTRGGYTPLAWDGRRLAWWGDRKLNVATYQNGALQLEQAVALEGRPQSLAWQGNRLLYTRFRETVNGFAGELYALEGGREVQLTQGAHARLLATDGQKVYFSRESDCFPFVPPQDGCNSSVMEYDPTVTFSGRLSGPSSNIRQVLEFEREHIVSLDAHEGDFLVGRWVAGGGKRYSLFRDRFEAPLELPRDALEAQFSEDGEVFYTAAFGEPAVPQTFQLGRQTPSVVVGGGSFSGRYAGGRLAFLNLTASGFVPVVQNASIEALNVAETAARAAVTRRQTSASLQPTRIALSLRGNWQPYRPQPRFWGVVPGSGQGLGLTAYGSDVSQNLAFAGSAFYNDSSGFGLAGQLRWQLERTQVLSVSGNTAQGFGVRFDQTLDTPLAPLTLSASLGYDGEIRPALGARLDTLERDSWGYPERGWSVGLRLERDALKYSAMYSRENFTVVGAGQNDTFGLEASYRITVPTPLRYADGLASLERISVLPLAGASKFGDALEFYGGAGLYLDGNLNYLLPYRLGLDLIYDSRGNLGVRFGSALALPF